MASTEQAALGKSPGDTAASKDNMPKADSPPNLRNPFGSSPTDQSSGEFLGKVTSATDREMRSGSSPISDSTSPTREGTDRRTSKEWDASKVPPSRFQKRAGSIFSTAGSRDSHVTRKDRDSSYHAKIKEKGWGEEKKAGLW